MKKTKKIPNYVRVQVLYESGIKKPSRISKLTKISLSTCYRFVKKLDKGLSLERKPGSGGQNRIKPQVVKKIISKSKSNKQPISSKKIPLKTKLSQASVGEIKRK